MSFLLLNEYVRKLSIEPKWVGQDFYVYYAGDIRSAQNVIYDFSNGEFILKTDSWPHYFGDGSSVFRQNVIVSGSTYKVSLKRGDGYNSTIPARETSKVEKIISILCFMK